MRPSIDTTMMVVAKALSKRATCARREVGCVLTDNKSRILSTGYNGVARGQKHCTDTPCAGAHLESGKGHDVCEAIHAEQNALLQCANTDMIETCYTTTAPCVACTKLLLNTECKRIVFAESYDVHSESYRLWIDSGRIWEQYYV